MCRLLKARLRKYSTITRLVHLKKKDYLLKEGQVSNQLFFVNSGCLRLFFTSKKGTEHITQFALENWWLADYMSFGQQVPSQFYIQAIEDSTVISIDSQAQEQLLKEVPIMERYFRLMFQRGYAAAQQRLSFFHDLSKEELYRRFTQSFPGFAQRVPQYMLASYLGLTPEYLSELRRKTE